MKEELKRKRFILITDAVILMLSIVSDRVLKIYAVNRLKDHPNKAIINGILEFRYLENSGAAFGLLKGQKSFFILAAVIILFAIGYALFKMPPKKHFYGAHITLAFIAGGAIGNLIDRIAYDHVVDYIYFSVIRFPIFNLADAFVTLSTIILLLLILFFYKEDDLNFLRFKEKKIRDVK